MTRYNKAALMKEIEGGLRVYQSYLDLEEDDYGKFKPTLNPCYEDTSPSLSVYEGYEDYWFHKDFGGSPDGKEYSGDCFDFVAQLYNLDVRKDFAKVMEIIAERLGIKLVVEDLNINLIEDSALVRDGYELTYDGNDKGVAKAHEYFSKYGITEAILKQYRVGAVTSYLQIKNGEVQQKKMFNTVIAFEDLWFVKFYCPDPKKSFWFLGKKDKEHVFGYKQIFRRAHKTPSKKLGDTIIITGGEKDVMTLASLGFDAITLNSETANVPSWLLDFLENFERVILLYDNDDTGIQMTKKLFEKYKRRLNISIYILPEELRSFGGKDISDYIMHGLNKEKLLEDIESIPKNNRDLSPSPELRLSRLFNGNKTKEGAAIKKLIEKQVDNIIPVNDKEIVSSIQSVGAVRESIKEMELVVEEKEIEYVVAPNNKNSSAKDVEPVRIKNGVDDNVKNRLPTLPEEVYELLPSLLKNITSNYNYATEKDLILLSCLTVLSSVFPNVHGMYDRVKIGLNIFLFVVAPPSSGKGLMGWAKRLGDKIDEHVAKQGKEFFLAADSSTVALYSAMERNKNFGVLFDNEGDTLAQMLKKEWSNFSPLLRKVFHHEPLKLSRKKAEDCIMIYKSYLSVLLSGTPNQVPRLIDSINDGLFSRFLFLQFDQTLQWKDKFSSAGESLEGVFNEYANQVLEMWKASENGDEIIINVSQDQRQRINAYFERRLVELVDEHGRDMAANVFRTAIIWYRLAMILTMVRSFESPEPQPRELCIDERDYRAAFLIVDTLLDHIKVVFEQMIQDQGDFKLNARHNKIFVKLPDKFKKSDYLQITDLMNIPKPTANKYLLEMQKAGVIHKVEEQHGWYQKID